MQDTPEIPLLDMKTRAIYWLLMQGLGVVVLSVVAWLLWQRQERFETMLRECQDSKVEALSTVVQQNTETLKILVTNLEAAQTVTPKPRRQ